ncbi:MAG: hypothetical protein Q8P86_03800 [bacterium]|nr:hypothetical protein [bacterium]
MKILIVGEEHSSKILVDYLERSYGGYQCTTTTTQEEAVKLLTEEKFDALITAYRLDAGNGITLLEKCSQFPGLLMFLWTVDESVRFRALTLNAIFVPKKHFKMIPEILKAGRDKLK